MLERLGGARARPGGGGFFHLIDQKADRLTGLIERLGGDTQTLLLLLDGLQESVDLPLRVHLELLAVILILVGGVIGRLLLTALSPILLLILCLVPLELLGGPLAFELSRLSVDDTARARPRALERARRLRIGGARTPPEI